MPKHFYQVSKNSKIDTMGNNCTFIVHWAWYYYVCVDGTAHRAKDYFVIVNIDICRTVVFFNKMVHEQNSNIHFRIISLSSILHIHTISIQLYKKWTFMLKYYFKLERMMMGSSWSWSYDSCNHYPSSLKLWVRTRSWFSPVSFINKTGWHNIVEKWY